MPSLAEKICSRLKVVPLRFVPMHLAALIELRMQPDTALRETYQRFMKQREAMNVTTNWLGRKSYFWLKYLKPLAGKAFDYLEVGSWEGTSACFMALNFPKATITCVDSWLGADDIPNAAGAEARFDENTAFFAGRLSKMKGLSPQVLAGLNGKKTYDVIYIDAAHYADDVMTDAMLCWPLLKKGGYLIFDDFVWDFDGFPERKWTNFAVKHFLVFLHGEYGLLHIGHQVILQRTVARSELVASNAG